MKETHILCILLCFGLASPFMRAFGTTLIPFRRVKAPHSISHQGAAFIQEIMQPHRHLLHSHVKADNTPSTINVQSQKTISISLKLNRFPRKIHRYRRSEIPQSAHA